MHHVFGTVEAILEVFGVSSQRAGAMDLRKGGGPVQAIGVGAPRVNTEARRLDTKSYIGGFHARLEDN